MSNTADVKMDYWKACWPTYMENWPSGLMSMSVASVDIPLTVDDARRLGTNIMEFGECFCETPEQREHNRRAVDYANEYASCGMLEIPCSMEPVDYIKPLWKAEDISDIKNRVGDAVAMMPHGAFVRLGSRSPKDSWEAHRRGSMRVTVEDDPLLFVLDASERVYEDLSLAIQHNYAPHIFVRQWLNIPRWSEFRCFMKERRLVGISQYQYLDGESFPEIARDASTIQWVIGEQFFPTFRRECHLESVVFDVFVKTWARRDNAREWEVKLLEINPFFELTDPCLFDWRAGFGGEIRFCKPKVGAC